MDKETEKKALPPCPFCGGGTTQIIPTVHWTGMRNVVIAVRITHWCDRKEGQPQSIINIAGKTEQDAIAAWEARGRASVQADPERVAQLIAHRACCGTEHDTANGKLHGCCVVCGVPWPCAYAGTPPASGQQGVEISHALQNELIEYFKQDFKSASSWDFTDQRKAEISVLLEAASPQITSPAQIMDNGNGQVSVAFNEPMPSAQYSAAAQPRDSVQWWRPISTAPKDGTSFLVCCGNWITVANWNRVRACLCYKGPTYDQPYPSDERPTHWMPLPEPPGGT